MVAMMHIEGRNQRLIGLEMQGFLRFSRGKFGRSRRSILASLHKEISMNRFIFPSGPENARDPLARLDALIAAAQADVTAADVNVAAIIARIAAIEPHPHAHGHTAAGDHAYAGIGPEHFLSLAGLLAQPWPAAFAAVERVRRDAGFDYLLKAFPSVFEAQGDMLVEEGARFMDARADRVDDDLTMLFKRKQALATGMVWRLAGFDRRDRDSWVGAFACGEMLATLIASADGVTPETPFGDGLAAAVTTHCAELAAVGARELHERAARRDAERQASWALVDEDYREGGAWRGRAPTKGQRHMMQRIEAARSFPMPITARRGASSDAITNAGGNPRFDTTWSGEKA